MRVDSASLKDLSAEEQQVFSAFSIGAQQHVPFQCVHHAFEFHAAEQPASVAVEHLDNNITYAELERKSNALALMLRSSGVRPGTRVCLLAQRSIPMIIGIMAILKAGGQYVPLDGGIVTQSTLDFVIEDSNAIVVLALREFIHRVKETESRRVVVLEDAIEQCNLPEADISKPIDLSSPNDGVYVIYTSGTD